MKTPQILLLLPILATNLAINLAAQIQPRRPGTQPSSSLSCRNGIVGASSLVARSNVQEVPIVTGIAASFRFEHVLLQESARFTSGSVSTLTVGVGRPKLGAEVVPPFPLKSDKAPHSFLQGRPNPPQLTGAYDLVLSFRASSPLGDGATSNFSAGTVTWEVCGYGGRPAPAR